MRIDINKCTAKVFHPLLKPILENEATEIVLPGGRLSTKSSFIGLIIVFGLMYDYHVKGELSNAVCLRKIAGTLSTSVYSQVLWAIDKLGVTDDWICTKSPLQCTYKPSGQQILFRGCDDPIKIKSIKFAKGYCKYCWFEEVNQFDNMAELRSVIQSLIRGGDGIIFYSFNPPPSKNNWANFEFSNKKKYRIIRHSTYLDVPKEWIGKTALRIAEELKATDLQAYTNEYLGEPVGLGGEVFNNIVDISLTDEDIWNLDKLRNGLDFGSSDPTAFTHLDYDYSNITFISEIYSPFILIHPLYEEIVKLINPHELIRADSREKTTIAELKQKGLNIIAASKPPDSVRHGIKWLQGVKQLRIDRKRCPKTYWEFSTYERERDKFGNYVNEFPDKNNHLIDSCRYALSDIINLSGWKVPKVR